MKKKTLSNKMLRYKIIDKHVALVRKGEYRQAKILLELLRKGRIALGMDDDSYKIECLLSEIGIVATYSRRWTAIFKLTA